MEQSHTHTHLDQILVALRVSFKFQRFEKLIVPSVQKLIEDVEVPLTVVLMYYTGFLQQVVDDVSAYWCPLAEVVEMDANRYC